MRLSASFCRWYGISRKSLSLRTRSWY